MAKYEDKVLDHSVDGIQEYDNPMPGWWLWTFYVAIVFSIVYLMYYALGFGEGYRSELRSDEIGDRQAIQDYYVANPIQPPTTEILLAGAVDPTVLNTGKLQFVKTCAPCHGEHGEGLIGPNLADNRWINVKNTVDIFTTIVKGVPAKGMPAWGRAFSPDDLKALAAYVRSLAGSNPANPKPAEGDPVQLEALPSSAMPSAAP